MPPKAKPLAKVEDALRAQGLGYPETTEDFPWGHRTLKVRGKAFVFMSNEGGELGLSMKLPQSRDAALVFPFAQPTGYGLGKSGWVSATFKAHEAPPLALLAEWLEESYRAVAPKKLIAQLSDAAARSAVAPPKPAQRQKKAPVRGRLASRKRPR